MRTSWKPFLRWIKGGLGACVWAAMSCGGRGKESLEEPFTGVLIDGPVSGVSYETESLSGVTDEAGTFEYLEGETVRFFLGGTTLGELPGQAQVSPFDLARIAPPVDDESYDAVEASPELFRPVNIAFLFQTLDRDATADNGIEVPSDVAALFDGVQLDLQRDPERFRTDHDFRSILNESNQRSLYSVCRPPAELISVMQHLYATLGTALALTTTSFQRVDSDADGTDDTISAFEFDEAGRVTAQRLDMDGDGTIDRFFEVDYDERDLVA